MDPLCVPIRELLPSQVSPGVCAWEVVEFAVKEVCKFLPYHLSLSSFPQGSLALALTEGKFKFCHSRLEQNGRVKSQSHSLCQSSWLNLMEYWTIYCGALNAQLNLQSRETKALQGRQITIAPACGYKQDAEICV